MSAGMGRAESLLRDTLQPYMGREAEDLTLEELEKAANRVRDLRGMAHENGMEDLTCLATITLRLVKEHRRERGEARRRRDRADGREL